MNNINSPVRVAVIGCTGLLGDIIRQTIRAEADLEVVAELAAPGTDFNLAARDPFCRVKNFLRLPVVVGQFTLPE